MQVKVLHFAQLRELCGATEEVLTVRINYSVSEAWDLLIKHHTPLADLPFRPLPAVNGAYASWETTLSDGDELVFLGPMSGG